MHIYEVVRKKKKSRAKRFKLAISTSKKPPNHSYVLKSKEETILNTEKIQAKLIKLMPVCSTT